MQRLRYDPGLSRTRLRRTADQVRPIVRVAAVPPVNKPLLKNALLLVLSVGASGLWVSAGAWAVDRHLLSDSYFGAAVVFGPAVIGAVAAGIYAARFVRIVLSKYVPGSNHGA